MSTPHDKADLSVDPIERASEWCLRLAEGDVTQQERQELDAWLAADEENARAFEDASRVWQSFEQMPPSDALSELRRDTLSRFEDAQAKHRRAMTRRTWIGALAASVTAAVIGVGFWMRTVPTSYVTAGQREVVTLEDGSTLSMDAQTRVDVRFSGVYALLAARGDKVAGYRLDAMSLTQSVVATGRVLSVSRAQVGSEVTGVVLERRVKEGDVVAPGDVLIVLRSDDLAAQVRAAEAALARLQKSTRPQAQVAQREAQAQLDQAQREAERRRDLFARGLIAREVLEQAEQAAIVARTAAQTARLSAESLAAGGPEEATLQEQLAAARAALEKTTIRSEVAGVVLTRNAEPGDLVQPGRVLFDIAQAGDTEILVPFDEKNLALLEVGQSASCIADAFPNDPFPAQITLVAPRVDPQRGTVDVRLRVQPVPEFLRQDMTVSVTVQTGSRERALVVPNDALMDVNGQQAAVTAVRDGRAQRVAVRLGLRSLTMSEVVEGLSEGDLVLVQGEQKLLDGDRVRVIEQQLPTSQSAGR